MNDDELDGLISPSAVTKSPPEQRPIVNHDNENLIFGFSERRMRVLFGYICAAAVALTSGVVFLVSVYLVIVSGVWIRVAEEHFAAMIGLPAAALTAFFVVLILSNVAGAIEVKFYGIEFRGAATPVIFWLLCYLGIAASIKMVW